MYNPPVQVTVALFYLYQLLGNAALVGLVVMLVLFPVTGVLSKKFSSNYVNMSKARDSRNDLVNEMLQGIRMIKYFAWESNWKDKIFEARKTELKKVIRTVTLDVCMGLCYNTVPVLVTASSFIWYTKVEGHELTASVAFVSITLFEMLRAPLVFIPESVTTLTEAYVSLKRISSYVDEHEISENEDKTPVVIPEGVTPEAILARTGFEQSVFQWHYKKEEVTNEPNTPELPTSNTASTITYTGNQSNVFPLQTPKFDFPTGKLTIVCGATGSGKSSLLHALLGEMDIVSGRVYLPSKTVMPISNYSRIDPEHPTLYLDRVAYVAQQPFLQHASIRDNILFGLPYDAQRYKSVLKQCALMKDLSILADGDRTEIGEKGISLSGGQKQRVSLARAVYSYAKTVILDDCLSAVDSHTAKHIYKNCINGNLLKGRTIILVTHHVRLCLPAANFFIKIENGQLVGCDTVAQLRTSGQLQRLLGNETVGDAGDAGEEIEGILEDDNGDFDLDLDSKAEAAKLVQDETTEKGQVKAKVYKTYLKACGGWPFWTALVLAYVTARLFSFGENWWLRIWASAYAKHGDAPMSLMSAQSSAKHGIFDTFTSTLQNQNVFRSWVFEQSEPINVDYYIGVYLLICFSFVLFDTSRVILLYWGSIRGARKLFEALLDRIIYAPMRFFDTTPVGRILNRFGKDITTIDLQISRSASFLIECTTGIAASIIIISAITPQFLIVAFGISGVYFLIGTYYLRISRELKRLNSVSRSPIYSHFTESLTGVTTIRAYGVQEEFMVTVYRKIDAYIAPFYFLWMSNRWLYARIEFTGAFVILFTGIFLIINISTIDAGMAGISLFYARSFLENIYWFIRQYTQVEMNLNSVERVQEYLEIDQEPPSVIEGHRPPAAWPTTASIEIKDLVIRYAPELDPVLHGISFKTKPHEKVGIVGRTGSGKSTMALSFFRFLEPSSGSISIDGIDITKIGIQDLRSRMTIIPQDAILFSGTIRTNLDPFNEHSDEELWESLDRAHLTRPSQRLKKDSPVSSSSNTVNGEEGHSVSSITRLDQKVSDGGNNFSQGQRQLLCLARALLKNSKLIIMDEATASVDFETDSKIQDTIRQEFTNSALLTIAHRLHTIIDYDRVLVLEQGKVIEFDTPYNLIQANSVFRSMCEKSGEFDVLTKMATASHKQKQQEEEEQDPDNHATVY
jgi:ABC-type multidrug transport system fused ATPase/permease subunit